MPKYDVQGEVYRQLAIYGPGIIIFFCIDPGFVFCSSENTSQFFPPLRLFSKKELADLLLFFSPHNY